MDFPWTVVAPGQKIPIGLTLFTYMFLHVNVVHLLSNTLALGALGGMAEPVMGAGYFASAYVLSGFGGALVLLALDGNSTTPVVGASLALSGILGIFLAMRSTGWSRTQRRWLWLSITALAWATIIWLCLRTAPPMPDRWTSTFWHLIPLILGFLAGSFLPRAQMRR